MDWRDRRGKDVADLVCPTLSKRLTIRNSRKQGVTACVYVGASEGRWGGFVGMLLFAKTEA